jgi:vacuolar protein sorting-associated protein 54
MASSTPRLSVDSLSPISPTPSRTEYPFPRLIQNGSGNVAEVLTVCRPGSNGRYQPRRGSTASSIHSIGGTLDTASHWHGVSESSQNGKFYNCQNPVSH